MLAPPPWELISGNLADQAPTASQQNQLLLGRSAEAMPPPPLKYVISAIVGFVALLALAFLGGHPKVHALERQFNIAHLTTTGLPFALLGVAASLPSVGILTPSVLREVAPLLPLGLGWIGFAVGSRFDARALERLPPATGAIVFVMTALPVTLILGCIAFAISVIRQQDLTGEVLRDAAMLATAGAMAARGSPEFLRALLPGRVVSDRFRRVVELEQLAGVFGVMMVSAFYRPPGAVVAWHLPGTAWLFIILGVGTTMGILIYAALNRINKDPQFTAFLLGAVAFTAGMASYLRLSPLSVCFLAGAITVNFAGQRRTGVREIFERLERPIYFVFMMIAGALWHPWEWQGWMLMLIFVVTRVLSKYLSSEMLRHWLVPDLNRGEQRGLTAAPMGALSIAIVVSAQDLFSGPTVSWIVTAVIAGSILTEVVLQLAIRKSRDAPRQTAGDAALARMEVD